MRRWTMRVLCWLALGAAVNVAVAWGIVSFATCKLPYPPKPRDDFFWNKMSFVPSDWPFLVGALYGNGWGFTVTLENSRSPRIVRPQIEIYLVRLLETGWPARSMRQAWMAEWRNSKSKEWWPESIAVPWQVRAVGIKGVPSRLLWPGFALNTLFYTLPIALLWLAPGTIRRWHRRRHQLCIHCAYPVADPAKPCSECGRFPTTR